MFVNRASWDMQQEVKSRCGWKEIERGSVEARKQQQDKIRKEKKSQSLKHKVTSFFLLDVS